MSDDELLGARARRLPDDRLVRRDVHGEHDGRASGRRSACRCPGSASPPAVDYRREVAARESGIAVTKVLELDLRPRQILTKEAFENAIAVVMAVAGSTNAVLHLLAIAREAHVDLTLDDFDRVSRRDARTSWTSARRAGS